VTGFWKNGGLRPATVLVAVLVMATALTACGRRGPLEPPPSATVLSTNAQGEVVEEPAPVEDRPFILDALIQ